MYSLALRQLPFPVVASPRIIYTHIYTHVSRCVHGFFSLFIICSLAITVPNALYGATRNVFLHINIRTYMYMYMGLLL